MVTPWDQRLGVWYIAEDYPDLTAIADGPGGVRLTYADLVARAHQIANALQGWALAPGSRIAMAFPNSADMILWQLACEEIGLRYILLNPALSAGEVRTIMELADAEAIVIDTLYSDRASELDRGDSATLRIAVGGPVADDFTPVRDFLANAPHSPPAHRTIGAPMIYTAGTTGRPKGIWHPLPEGDPSIFADLSKTFAHAFRFRPFDGAHLVSAGMYHGGCLGFYKAALNVGQPLVIMGRFDAQRALELIDEHQVTTAYMVPTQFVRFLRVSREARTRFDGSSLQSVVHSAAPCPLEVKKHMMDWWGPVIWETYGGTEGAATIAKPYRWLEKPGTVGRSVKGVNVRILDNNGNQLPSYTTGHVYIELANGRRFRYLNDDEGTEAVYRGAAFTLGDLGHLDEDGYLFLSGRAKDMIITGGTNVYPAEVEGWLIMHPAVSDVAVIGVPDHDWGESVKAVVQLAAGHPPSDELAAELMQYCFDHLAHFKCPRSVDFRTNMPRTEAGKLMKRHLRDEYGMEGTNHQLSNSSGSS
jgi:long-chain acyl-CoA synthetase